eukprot:4876932-Alexandrium_andersonii.AAC.2
MPVWQTWTAWRARSRTQGPSMRASVMWDTLASLCDKALSAAEWGGRNGGSCASPNLSDIIAKR